MPRRIWVSVRVFDTKANVRIKAPNHIPQAAKQDHEPVISLHSPRREGFSEVVITVNRWRKRAEPFWKRFGSRNIGPANPVKDRVLLSSLVGWCGTMYNSLAMCSFLVTVYLVYLRIRARVVAYSRDEEISVSYKKSAFRLLIRL